MDLRYSDGIAAARTMLALEGNAAALQTRLPDGWDLAPYAGNDLGGTALHGANLLVPFHEVYAVHTPEGAPAGIPLVSYIAFVSLAAIDRPANSGTSTGAPIPRIPPPYPANTAMADSLASSEPEPSPSGSAARPTSITDYNLTVRGERSDVFDRNERLVGIVIQRPYMCRVYQP